MTQSQPVEFISVTHFRRALRPSIQRVRNESQVIALMLYGEVVAVVVPRAQYENLTRQPLAPTTATVAEEKVELA